MAGCTAKFGQALAVVALCMFCAVSDGQAPANAPVKSSDELKSTLLAVRDAFGFQTVGRSPSHLKAHLTTFDMNGKPDGTGTLEEYWDGKDRLRRELQYRGITDTIWRTPTEYHKSGTFRSSYFMQRLIPGFEGAVPPARILDTRTLSDKEETVGSVPMHCILVRPKASPAAPPMTPLLPYGPPDEQAYCLSDADRFLRLQQSYPGVVLVFNKLHSFDKGAVPFTIRMTQGNMQRGEFQVDTLESWTPDDAVFVPPADLQPAAKMDMAKVVVSGGLIAGTILSKKQPAYPSIARAQHLQGQVILAASITKQGTISNLEVVTSPGSSLTEAAVEAVKQWTYKPFILNGNPAEVDTTITVNFFFGNH